MSFIVLLTLRYACEGRHNAMIIVFEKKIAKDHLIHFYGSTLSGFSICTVSSLRELVVPMDD